MEHEKYAYADKAAFLADVERLGVELPFADGAEILADPMVLPMPGCPDEGASVSAADDSAVAPKALSVANRLVAQPIECNDADEDDAPSNATFDRYRRLAQGGVGLIWVESTSVDYEGKARPHQLWIRPENVGRFADLARVIHEGGALAALQLTHSGRSSNPDGAAFAVCAYENPLMPVGQGRIIADAELPALEDDYVAAARLARDAGFDAVDIRACHGYLLSEFLSAYRRPGLYGGSLANRSRLLLETVARVRREVPDIAVFVRLGAYDGLPYPYGFGVLPREEREGGGEGASVAYGGASVAPTPAEASESAEPETTLRENAAPAACFDEVAWVAQRLSDLGVSLINVSAGIGGATPQVMRPFDTGGPIPEEHPLEGVARLLQAARAVKRACPQTLVAASGFSWLRDFAAPVAAGGIEQGWFDLAGFGRQWVADPSFAREILACGMPAKLCRTCTGCSALLARGRKVSCIHKK